MFVVLLSYQADLSAIDHHLEAHRAWLDRQYAEGRFLASGPRVPRTGGIILARSGDREELLDVLSEDPFQQQGLAKYEVLEFVANKHAPALAGLV